MASSHYVAKGGNAMQNQHMVMQTKGMPHPQSR
jgi:hypothetical protein